MSERVATLIANPANPSLTPELADKARDAASASGVYFLADGIACDLPLHENSGDRAEILAALDGAPIDVVVQEADSRRKSVLLADMDSTMIQQECIDELADVAGVGDRVKDITARAMNGELDFEAAIRERVGLLKGLPEAVIAQVLETRISLMPGGPVLLATMKAHGAYAALVSGGFTAFTAAVAARLGFDENRANTLLVQDGVLTGEVGTPILGQQAKVDALGDITETLGIGPDAVLAVGDGANDLGMLHRAGLGVALHAKPAVAAQCDVRVNFGDLTALLFLQGYARSEFVTP